MRLTLRARILAVFLVAVVAFLAALGYGLVQVRGIGSELTRVQDVWLPLSRKVTEIRSNYAAISPAEVDERLQPRARRQSAESDTLLLHRLRDMIKAAQADATGALQHAEGSSAARMTQVVTSLGDLTQPMQEIVPALGDLLTELEKGDAKRIAAARGRLSSIDRRIRETLGKTSEEIDGALREDSAAARVKAQSSLFALAALTLLATGFGIVAVAIVGRALAPVADLIAGARRISAGDFDRRIEIGPGASEIGTLAREFNGMAESLRSRDERLRRLSAYNENVLESVRVGILVADEHGAVTGMNHAAEEIWGLPRGGLVSKPLSAIAAAAGKEGPTILERVESVRAGGAAVRLGAVAFPSGRMVEVSVVPFLESGKAAGVVIVAEDVTERVGVERALLRSERLAAIGRMSSQITHEVRNPLNSMSLNVEMLQEELSAKEGEARELLAAIAKEIERLTEITEGYLGFARLPKPQLEREQVNAVVGSLLKFVREEAGKAGVKVVPELGSDLPDVLADENQLRQALLNVVRNSLEALGSNGNQGGTLAVCTRRTAGQVEVLFRDDGPGIPSKDLARIFDPFYSSKKEGTGLGLPLTQQIIEEHGGTIACASEPGRGTVFTIRLPAVE